MSVCRQRRSVACGRSVRRRLRSCGPAGGQAGPEYHRCGRKWPRWCHAGHLLGLPWKSVRGLALGTRPCAGGLKVTGSTRNMSLFGRFWDASWVRSDVHFRRFERCICYICQYSSPGDLCPASCQQFCRAVNGRSLDRRRTGIRTLVGSKPPISTCLPDFSETKEEREHNVKRSIQSKIIVKISFSWSRKDLSGLGRPLRHLNQEPLFLC